MNADAIQIRLERPGEARVAEQIVRDAFGDELTPQLLRELRTSDAWR